VIEDEPEPHDAHVQLANKLFRDVGFTLAAMQFKRSPESLQALRDFNRVPATWQHPIPWEYHPNRWLAQRDVFVNTTKHAAITDPWHTTQFYYPPGTTPPDTSSV
jgi:hypothetical protein